MALSEKKVTESVLGMGVSSAPDRLIGTAAENKAVFDRLICTVVAESLNPLIDELVGTTGAENIGTAKGSVKDRLEVLDQHAQSRQNPHEITAEKIGADTPEGAQSKADSALALAKEYTDKEVKKQLVQAGGVLGDDDGNAKNSLKLAGKLPSAYIQPNPNLLDNAWFDARHRVNQMKKTQYSGVTYTIDRWKLSASPDNLTLNNDCIVLYGTGGADASLIQFLGNRVIYPGTYTLTAEAEGTIGLGYFDDQLHELVKWFPQADSKTTMSYTFTIETEVADQFNRAMIFSPRGISSKIYRVKLEVGEAFTGWAEPKPGETLAECQRYLTVFSADHSGYVAQGNVTSATTADLCLVLPVTPRAEPQMSILGELVFWYRSGPYATPLKTANILYTWNANNQMRFRITGLSGLVEGHPCFLEVGSRGSLVIDANL